MQVTKEQLEPCTVALDIRVEPEAVSRAFGQAYREFAQFTNVPGFRRGKAPRQVVERFVNKEKLRERVMELVAAPAYQEALKQESIEPYAEPQVEFSDLADGQPWQFKALVPTEPRVTLGDHTNIAVERPTYSVTQEEVEAQVDRLRADHARMVAVDSRGVEAGDTVIAETAITLDGDETPAEPQRTLLRMGDNIPGFDEAVIGQQVDEERTFNLTFPDDYDDKRRAGKQATFQVRIASISQRVLPELTDEWAAGVTSYKTVGELREAAQLALEEQAERLSDRMAEVRVIDALVKSSAVEFPSVMVQQELDEDTVQFYSELQQRKMTYEEYLSATGQSESDLHDRMRATAYDRVRTALVLRELAKTLNLAVSRDEVAEELARMVTRRELSEDQARKMLADQKQQARLIDQILRRKLMAQLMASVRVTDVPVKDDATPEA